MLIYIGADHRGFKLKESLKNYLKQSGYEVVDVGAETYNERDDYPDFAVLVARKISLDSENSRGILICGSGAGVDIVANKFSHVRSVLALNAEQVLASKNDDDTNVLSFASDYIEEEDARRIVAGWLSVQFSGEERFLRRLRKIEDLENRK